MTTLSPAQRCDSCDGNLVPPVIASNWHVPDGTDYVCLKCGCPYHWTATTPPRLVTRRSEQHGGLSEPGDDSSG